MSHAPTHVFVAVDADVSADAELSRHLVDVACAWARPAGARMTIGHVALPLVTSPLPPRDAAGDAYRAMTDVLEARNAAAARTLDALKAQAMRDGCAADVLLVTHPGQVADLIVETARQVGADAIMVATHGRRGIRRLVLGSVAERVSHLAHVPVLLVPPERSSSYP